MTDKQQTVEDLLREVETLRARVAELEGQSNDRSDLAAALPDPESLLESIYYGVDTCLWITEVREDGEFVWIHNNPADQRLTGLDLRDPRGIRFEDVMSPEDAAFNRRWCQDVIATGKPVTFEDRFLIDGQERWSLNTLLPLRDASGRIHRIVGAGLDITDRKRAEERARLEREKLQVILDALPAMVFIKDKDNRLIGLNQAFADHTGLAPDSVMDDVASRGQSGFEICPTPEQADTYWSDDKEVMATGRPKRGIIEPLLTDPSRWFQTDKVPYCNEEGEIVGVIGCSIEMTQRKKAEDLLRIQRDLGIAFASTSDLSEAMSMLLEAALRIEGIDCGGVYVVDETTRTIRTVAHRGVSEAFVNAVSSLDAASPQGQALLTGEPQYIRPSLDKAPWHDHVVQEGLLSFAAIPVFHDETVIAALCLGSHTCDEISQDAKDAIDAIAARIGPVVARVRAEQALRESEDRNRALLAAIPDMMFHYTREGVTVDFKPAADFSPIVPESEFLNRPLHEILPEDAARMQLNAIEKALTQQQVQTIEYALPDGDGRRHFEGRMVPCGTDQVMLIVRDISQRVRADRALRQTRTNLQNLFDTMDDMIFVLDDQARIVHTNPVVSQRLGYTPEDLRRLAVPDLHPPERREEARAILSDMLAGRASVCPIPLLTQSGGLIPTETKVTRGQWGDQPALFGIARDVTERQWAERRLRAQRDLGLRLGSVCTLHEALDVVLESALQTEGVDCCGFYVVEERTEDLVLVAQRCLDRPCQPQPGKFASDSEQAAAIMRGQPIAVARHGPEEATALMWSGEGVHGTVVIPVQHGDRVVASLHLASCHQDEIPLSTRHVLEAVAAHMGAVIARLRAERERERLREIIETTTDFVSMSDPSGRILYMNRAGRSAVGRAPGEPLGDHSLTSIYPAWAWRKIREEGIPAAVRDGVWRGETACLDAEGNEVPASQIIMAHRSSDGEVEYFSTILHDVTDLKMAERNAREQQRFVQKIADSAPFMLFLLNLEDRAVEFVNPYCQKLLGYSPEKLYAMGEEANPRIVHPDDLSILDDVVERLRHAADGEVVDCIVRARHANGSRRWLHISDVVFERHEDGTPRSVLGTTQDVTDRMEAQAELQRQRDFAESLVNTAQTIVLVLDTEGRIVYFNPYMERVSGYRLEEVRGQDWFATFVQPHYRDSTREVFEATMKGADTNGTVGVHLNKEGKRREIEWYGEVMADADGQVIGLLCTGQDITERRQAEEALRESESRYRQIVETAQEGILETDTEGRILYLNERMAQMLGYTGDELLGRSILNLVEPDRRVDVLAALERRKAGKSETIERCYVRKDGAPLWTIAALSPSRDRSGRIIGSLGMFTDITDRKRAEELARQHQTDLAHASRLATMGEMASGLAHELNQPLGAICTYAGHCRRLAEGDDRKAVLELIEKMDAQARRASEIIRRIRSFASKRPAIRKCIDINNLIRETLALLEWEARRLGITVTMTLCQEPLVATIDEIQIQQIFINLVRNAFDSIREGSGHTRRITIESALVAVETIRVAVTDTGIGFDEESKERLFEPFFTTKPDGMGMGLSICQSIAQAHSGRLWGTSNPQGGATFFLELPA